MKTLADQTKATVDSMQTAREFSLFCAEKSRTWDGINNDPRAIRMYRDYRYSAFWQALMNYVDLCRMRSEYEKLCKRLDVHPSQPDSIITAEPTLKGLVRFIAKQIKEVE